MNSEPIIEIRVGLGRDTPGMAATSTPPDAATTVTTDGASRDGGPAPTGPEAAALPGTALSLSTTDGIDGGPAPQADLTQISASTQASGFGTAVQAEEAGEAPAPRS